LPNSARESTCAYGRIFWVQLLILPENSGTVISRIGRSGDESCLRDHAVTDSIERSASISSRTANRQTHCEPLLRSASLVSESVNMQSPCQILLTSSEAVTSALLVDAVHQAPLTGRCLGPPRFCCIHESRLRGYEVLRTL
jgi:hypothetical protein